MSRQSKLVPPHNLEAEASLLGAILLAPEVLHDVWPILGPEDFYRPAHAQIYDACVNLYEAGSPIDVVTVADRLKQEGLLENIGGPFELMELQSATPATSNARSYAEIVARHSKLRALQMAGQDISRAIADGTSLEETSELAEGLIYEITASTQERATLPSSEIVYESLAQIEQIASFGQGIVGIETGYRELDNLLAGLQENAFYIIGARPSMGKSVAAVGIAMHAALEQDLPVLFFSLEMGREELIQRMICADGLIDLNRYRNGKLSNDEWIKVAKTLGRLERSQLWIDDSPGLSIGELRGIVRRITSRVGKLGVIVIDYLQLMASTGGENRQQAISEISRGLKILAREFEVPVVALSQLSRGLEMRVDKRPMLADLRESGSLEQDADVVMFIYRDQVYNEESSDAGLAEFIVAKQRSGPTGTVKLGFMDEHTRFVNIASS